MLSIGWLLNLSTSLKNAHIKPRKPAVLSKVVSPQLIAELMSHLGSLLFGNTLNRTPGSHPQITRGTKHMTKVKNGFSVRSVVISNPPPPVTVLKKLAKPNTTPKTAPYTGPSNTEPTATGRQLSVIVSGPNGIVTKNVNNTINAAKSAQKVGFKYLGEAFFFVFVIKITSCCFPVLRVKRK